MIAAPISPFDSTSTAADVISGTDLCGHRALVTAGGLAAHALDPAAAEQMWTVSEQLLRRVFSRALRAACSLVFPMGVAVPVAVPADVRASVRVTTGLAFARGGAELTTANT